MPEMPDVIVLCGGAGTRLRAVTGESPKSMAMVAGRPFLDLLLAQLDNQGFRKVILASGYHNEAIREHFGTRVMNLAVVHSAEDEPLGTGGAVVLAAKSVDTATTVVMNGDSYTELDLNACIREHCENEAEITVVVTAADGRRDCGNVSVDPTGIISEFREKKPGFTGRYANAGIYVINTRLLQSVSAGVKLSLELELFPRWIGEGRKVRAYRASGVCVDIGTPERYQLAQTTLAAKQAELTR